VNTNQVDVYRLVYEETGEPLGTYGRQFLYSEIGPARGVCTKYNKSWRKQKVVIQHGTVEWSSEPV
jgi:hypothetical protein